MGSGDCSSVPKLEGKHDTPDAVTIPPGAAHQSCSQCCASPPHQTGMQVRLQIER